MGQSVMREIVMREIQAEKEETVGWVSEALPIAGECDE